MNMRPLALMVVIAITTPAMGQELQTENPPEPESHGTRLRWQDIPKKHTA
jgi:hypothetical protein